MNSLKLVLTIPFIMLIGTLHGSEILWTANNEVQVEPSFKTDGILLNAKEDALHIQTDGVEWQGAQFTAWKDITIAEKIRFRFSSTNAKDINTLGVRCITGDSLETKIQGPLIKFSKYISKDSPDGKTIYFDIPSSDFNPHSNPYMYSFLLGTTELSKIQLFDITLK